jgi:DNA-binding MarR family transcriptional regulator
MSPDPDARDVLQALAEAAADDLPHLLRTASRAVDSAVGARMASLGYDGVRMAHAAVFRNLDPEGTRMVTLAQRAGISRQAIGQLVQDLQTAGYVEVAPDPQDGRATRVLLTQRGIAFCAQAAVAVRELEQQWQDALGAGPAEQLRAALRLLAGTGEG